MKTPYSRVKNTLFSLCACLITLSSHVALAASPSTPTLSLPVTVQVSKPSSQYLVDPSDQTIRQTIQRWAHQDHWSFPNENWVPNVDVPVIGSAAFPGDFIKAVQGLVASTELTDTPLQPCFYQNDVVRVIYFNQSCDKMSEQ